MASWILNNRKYLIRTGIILTGWVVGTAAPNTVLIPVFDRFAGALSSFYKDIKFDRKCMEVYQETVRELNALRNRPVNTDRLDIRFTTNIPPNFFTHKGSSRLSSALVIFPIGMRVDARDAFYLHCPYTPKEELENTALLTRDEQKFLYALTMLYTEDNFFLYRTAIGAGIIAVASACYLFVNSLFNELLKRKKMNLLKQYQKKNAIELINGMVNRTAGRFLFYKRAYLLLLSGLAVHCYLTLKSRISLKLEKEAHETVSELGLSYTKSAVTYFQKCLEFHARLRVTGDATSEPISRYPLALTYGKKMDIYLDQLEKLHSS